MGLNIKNEHVHELAREAARRTGRTQTGAIQLALEKLLAESEPVRRAEDKRRRIDLVLRDVDLAVTDEIRAAIHVDLAELYDARGLPR
jgi:antitoxin VapB